VQDVSSKEFSFDAKVFERLNSLLQTKIEVGVANEEAFILLLSKSRKLNVKYP
jgi:hypothetical protein